MKNIIATSSGRVFMPKEKKKRKVIKIDNAQKDFIQKCVNYGLTPDFYQQGCLSETGEFLYLIGFDGNCAKLESLAGIQVLEQFEVVLTMIKTQLDNEYNEIRDKMDLLFISKETKDEERYMRNLKLKIQDKRKCVNKASQVYNGHMNDVLKKMHLPASAFACGCIYNKSICEFVSYREDKENPYVLEDICKNLADPNRFYFVSYDALKRGVTEYAKTENTNLVYALENMCPMPYHGISEITEINCGYVQQTLFA